MKATYGFTENHWILHHIIIYEWLILQIHNVGVRRIVLIRTLS